VLRPDRTARDIVRGPFARWSASTCRSTRHRCPAGFSSLELTRVGFKCGVKRTARRPFVIKAGARRALYWP